MLDRISELTDAIETGEIIPDIDDHLLIAALQPGSAEPQPDAQQPAELNAANASATPRTVSRTIRLPVDLLDRMMAGVSDMIDALLNNETSFFRDAAVFSLIADRLLPQIAAQRQHDKRIRIWSAACSTGQEAYSLAMMFADQGKRWDGWKIEILGSDISRSAIQQARGALYSQLEVQRGLPIRQLIAWFDPVLDQGWRVKHGLGSTVTFMPTPRFTVTKPSSWKP